MAAAPDHRRVGSIRVPKNDFKDYGVPRSPPYSPQNYLQTMVPSGMNRWFRVQDLGLKASGIWVFSSGSGFLAFWVGIGGIIWSTPKQLSPKTYSAFLNRGVTDNQQPWQDLGLEVCHSSNFPVSVLFSEFSPFQLLGFDTGV